MSLKNSSAKIKIPKIFESKLKNKRINRIYNLFEKSLAIEENFAVAVSGGPDSIALSFLAKIYSIKNGLQAKFFIVDHKLRPESTKEAKTVKSLLKKKSISAEILTWNGKKPVRNIQSLARINRYRLLFKRCDEFHIKNVLMGHHQDDLIENFFIRILRGSGLKGLTSLNEVERSNNKNLLRPLLKLKKEDLIFLANEVFDFFVQDPSNHDEKYLRIRIRNLIKELQKNGLDQDKLTKTIQNLKYSNSVVDFYVKENLLKNSSQFENGNKFVLNKFFFKQPHEIVFRGLSELIKLVGKRYYSVRGKKLDRIISDISKKQIFRATLGGCIIEKVSQTLIISKEH